MGPPFVKNLVQSCRPDSEDLRDQAFAGSAEGHSKWKPTEELSTSFLNITWYFPYRATCLMRIKHQEILHKIKMIAIIDFRVRPFWPEARPSALQVVSEHVTIRPQTTYLGLIERPNQRARGVEYWRKPVLRGFYNSSTDPPILGVTIH